MMKLIDAISYICVCYPYKDDMSDARLNKTLYLADWKASLMYGRTLTDIQWKYNHYGPYVDDILLEAQSYPQILEIITSENMYGSKKKIIRLKKDHVSVSLLLEEKEILDEVIKISSGLNFKALLDLVYSTYPIMSQPRNSMLDLPTLASNYQKLQKRAAS